MEGQNIFKVIFDASSNMKDSFKTNMSERLSMLVCSMQLKS